MMLAYKHGDEMAFEALYFRYEKPILNFIYRMVMNVTDAENLCQETFFRLIRARKKYEHTARFKTWFYQIALNLCRDRSRRMKHRSHLSLDGKASSHADENVSLKDIVSDPSANFEGHLETEELGNLIQKAIGALSEDEHFVVTMKEYQELKLSEIADIMDCPVGTVKSHNHRAHKKLAQILAPYIGE